jgi:hypothetical protein
MFPAILSPGPVQLPKILLIAPRAAWPPYSGDRLRAQMWVEALRDEATLVLVTPAGGEAPSGIGVIEAKRSRGAAMRAVPGALLRGRPLHTLLTAPWDWRGALADARARHGEFDVAIVLLTRTDPAVFDHLPARRRILDAIDSAARGMRERGVAATSAVARLFWRREAAQTAALERSAASRYEAVVTVSPLESAAFGERGITIPMGVDVFPLAATGRRYDFGFWGRFPYFANEEAVRAVLEVIWPQIRRLRPASTLFLGGADAPRWLRAYDGRDGISLVSPVADRQSALRQVQVALFPILRGTGQSLKTLESAEAACAIIGTGMAFRGVEELAAAAVIEDEVQRFAGRAVSLIEGGAVEMGRELRALVVSHHDRRRSLERMRDVALEDRP